MNNIEFEVEESNIKEFLKKFSEIAEVKYKEVGLVGYIVIVHEDAGGIFQIVAQKVNEEYGWHGWGDDVSGAISRSLGTLSGVKTRDYVNVVHLNDSCVLCSLSDDAKGYPERNDKRDIQIIMEVLDEMGLE